MKNTFRIRASALPTVLSIAVVMLLVVMGVLWASQIEMFVAHDHNLRRRYADNIRSAEVLYATHSAEILPTGTDSATVRLYDDLAESSVLIERCRWGLYELVCFTSGGVCASRIVGMRHSSTDSAAFFCRNNHSSLQLSGRTNLRGRLLLPAHGVVYKALGSRFFEGEQINAKRIERSSDTMPRPVGDVIGELKRLVAKLSSPVLPQRAERWSATATTQVFSLPAESSDMYGYDLSGKLIVEADSVRVDSTCKLENIILLVRKVVLGNGFSGRIQVFASDSVLVGERVSLDWPSGVFSERYVGIGRNARVAGYVAVDSGHVLSERDLCYRQSRTAVIRGLLYVWGNAHVEGLVVGSAFIET